MLLPSAQSAREKQALALAGNTWQRWVRGHGSEAGRIDLDDLRGAVMLGAAKALAQFDETRGTKFSSYAISLIRGEIMENAREQDHLTRAARAELRDYQRETAQPWEQAMAADYEQRTGKRWQFVTSDFPIWAMPPVELDAPTALGEGADDEGGMRHPTGFERLEDRLAPAAEEEALARVESAELLRAVSWLPARERAIVWRYYYQDRTCAEIAREMGCCESNVFRLLAQARVRLAGFLAAEAFS